MQYVMAGNGLDAGLSSMRFTGVPPSILHLLEVQGMRREMRLNYNSTINNHLTVIDSLESLPEKVTEKLSEALERNAALAK